MATWQYRGKQSARCECSGCEGSFNGTSIWHFHPKQPQPSYIVLSCLQSPRIPVNKGHQNRSQKKDNWILYTPDNFREKVLEFLKTFQTESEISASNKQNSPPEGKSLSLENCLLVRLQVLNI